MSGLRGRYYFYKMKNICYAFAEQFHFMQHIIENYIVNGFGRQIIIPLCFRTKLARYFYRTEKPMEVLCSCAVPKNIPAMFIRCFVVWEQRFLKILNPAVMPTYIYDIFHLKNLFVPSLCKLVVWFIHEKFQWFCFCIFFCRPSFFFSSFSLFFSFPFSSFSSSDHKCDFRMLLYPWIFYTQGNDNPMGVDKQERGFFRRFSKSDVPELMRHEITVGGTNLCQ